MKKTLAIMLALIMVLALVPTVAFAAGNTIYVDATNGNDTQDGVGTASDKAYKSLDKAMEAANDGATIYLAAGTYCGNSANPSEAGKGAGKNLTFVGAGSDKTTWQIRAKENNLPGDGPCDYSFDGSDRITFEKMTIVGSVHSDDSIKAEDFQGFVRIKHVKLIDCTFNGYAGYWGYKTTTFEDVTFNAPGTEASGITDVNYSLWTWTGTEYRFNNCTFNSAGKVINAYRGDGGSTEGNPIVLNFKDCNVVSSGAGKSVLNIKDANNYYTVNISGTNTVKGLDPNEITCSRLFQVEGYADDYNLSGGEGNSKNCQATVTIDGTTVWTGGRMKSHAIDTTNDKYTDGYKDNAFTVEPNGLGSFEVKCIYCGHTETSTGGLYNDIGLTRTVEQTVTQNNINVNADAANPNKYKVANSSNITVDYTATMDMTKLEWKVAGKDVDVSKLLNGVTTPWELLKALASARQIDGNTEVILNFTFDDKIDLETFQTNYNKATTTADKEKLLKLTSDMFEIATDGVQFDIANRKMTIKCKWNLRTIADTPAPFITLNGYGLPVKDNWGGSKIDIKNSGCVSGTVSISNPKPLIAKVAANQVQNNTPPVDNTIRIPIVGGCKTDEFTLYYGGGSSDGGHSHYYPTTTPVPVIVIPPKTGDMTIWQSILHFLGIK